MCGSKQNNQREKAKRKREEGRRMKRSEEE